MRSTGNVASSYMSAGFSSCHNEAQCNLKSKRICTSSYLFPHFSFSYKELEQKQSYSGHVKYEGIKHQPNGETVFFSSSLKMNTSQPVSTF